MLKKVIAVVLIVLASGAWFYLDQLNKEEQRLAEETRQTLLKARAEAAARAAALERFKTEIMEALNACKAKADQAKADFLVQNQQPVRRKPGQFTLPEAIKTQADNLLAAAYSECQQAYDTRLAQGN
ncbi:MAG: hypothetical protein Fur0026_06370 [Sideroxydans sp.]